MSVVFQLNHEKSAKKLDYTMDGVKGLELSRALSLQEVLGGSFVLARPSLNYGFFSFDDYVYDEHLNVLYVPDLFNISLSGVEKRRRTRPGSVA